MPVFQELKRQFGTGGYLVRLLYINCGMFIILKLALVACMLFELPVDWVPYLELPSSLGRLLRTPWTVLTYMFVHVDFLHAIFNLLALYWFGKIFLRYFSQKQLVGVYILGGFAGAFTYVMALNTIPYFGDMRDFSYLIGASASVMGIIFASAAYYPDDSIRLALIGEIKLKYVGLAVFLLDVIGFSSSDLGGTMAHAGGALSGLLYGFLLRKKNVDLSSPVTAIMNFFFDLHSGMRKRKPKMKVKVNPGRPKTDEEWNKQNNSRNNRIDSILEKIKKSGYANLSDEEKRELFDLSNKK